MSAAAPTPAMAASGTALYNMMWQTDGSSASVSDGSITRAPVELASVEGYDSAVLAVDADGSLWALTGWSSGYRPGDELEWAKRMAAGACPSVAPLKRLGSYGTAVDRSGAAYVIGSGDTCSNYRRLPSTDSEGRAVTFAKVTRFETGGRTVWAGVGVDGAAYTASTRRASGTPSWRRVDTARKWVDIAAYTDGSNDSFVGVDDTGVARGVTTWSGDDGKGDGGLTLRSNSSKTDAKPRFVAIAADKSDSDPKWWALDSKGWIWSGGAYLEDSPADMQRTPAKAIGMGYGQSSSNVSGSRAEILNVAFWLAGTPTIPTITATHTLTFQSNGGTSVPAQTVNDGDTPSKPAAPVRSGFTFDGWYTDDNTFNDEFDFTQPMTADTTVYAKWTSDTVAAACVPVTGAPRSDWMMPALGVAIALAGAGAGLTLARRRP